LSSSLQQLTEQLKLKIDIIKSSGSNENHIQALRDISLLMEQAWAIPTHGRDVAYNLCDMMRDEHALDIVIGNCASKNKELMKTSGRLLDKVSFLQISSDVLNKLSNTPVQNRAISNSPFASTVILTTISSP
jgi:hypothetical protein